MRLAATVLVAAFTAVAPTPALAQITIGTGAGPASPYPSTLERPPEHRIVEDVDVRMTDLDHDFPDELDIAVTGPGDRTVMLMADLGSTTSCSGLPDLRFSAQAPDPVPAGPLPCDGTYRPFDRDPAPGDFDEGDSDLFAPPAPVEPFATTLDVFNGSMMGGTWSLRVMDDTADDGGTIAAWGLQFDTRLPGRVRLPGTGIHVPETQPLVLMKLTRSGGSAAAPLGDATVSWTSRPCGAGAPVTVGEDVSATAGSVGFTPGATEALAGLAVLDDRLPEPTECIRVVLAGATGDGLVSTTIEEFLEIHLTNDDQPAELSALVAGPPQRVLRAKAVKVTASSVAHGTLSATGRVALPRKAAATVRLKPARPVAVTPGQRVGLRLGLSRKALRAVRRALARRPRLVATVNVSATDLAGGRATGTVRVRLRR